MASALESGADLNYRGYMFNGTALHRASVRGHLLVVQLLVECGADINAVDNWNCAPLHDAACNGHLQVVKFLVGRGADTEVVNCKGRTTMERAAERGQ